MFEHLDPDLRAYLERALSSDTPTPLYIIPERMAPTPMPPTIVPNVGAILQHQTPTSKTTAVLSPDVAKALIEGAATVGVVYLGGKALAEIARAFSAPQPRTKRFAVKSSTRRLTSRKSKGRR